tara:strand:+ start:17082 stop:17510 length:429 start_codon:yes stop_codon:yes gene_type:complete
MFHVKQPPSPTRSMALDNARAARWRQCENDVRNRRCCPRHYGCKSDECQVFFAGLHIIFLIVSSLRQCESEVKKRCQAPRHFTRKARPCQVLFADMCKIILIEEGLGAGLQIHENYGKLQKIKLDTKTPRAAPGNSFALFYD